MKNVFLSKDSRHKLTLRQDDGSEVVVMLRPLDTLTLLSLMEEHEVAGNAAEVEKLPLVIDFVRLSVTDVAIGSVKFDIKFEKRALKYRTLTQLDEESLAMFSLEAIQAIAEEVAKLNQLTGQDEKNS